MTNHANQNLRVHNYLTRSPRAVWGSMEISSQPHPITSTTLTTNDDGTELTIQFCDAGAIEAKQAREITEEAARKIINRLSYNLNHFLPEPIYVGGLTVEIRPDGTKIHHVNCGVGAKSAASLTDTHYYGDEAKNALQKMLNDENRLAGEDHYDTYRTLLGISDTVAKYLFLYLMLMCFYEDEQGEVDEFIRKHEPDVQYEMTKRVGKDKTKLAYETVYTRLRNQASHDRKVPMQETRAEMETKMSGLMNLVRKRIEAESLPE